MKITPENHLEVGECDIIVPAQTSDQKDTEYRVRPVVRYIITEFDGLSRQIGSDQSSYETAFLIAEALANERNKRCPVERLSD